MAVAAIWWFEVITRAAVCLNPADMYGTDLMQRRVCTRVRVQVHACSSITPLEFQRYYSRVRVLSLVCNPRVCHSLG